MKDKKVAKRKRGNKEQQDPESSLVLYHNDLNYVQFGKFTATDLNNFFALISKLHDTGDKEVTVSAQELKKMTNYSQRGNAALFRELVNSHAKFWNLTYYQKSNNVHSFLRIFDKFSIDEEKMSVTLRVSEENRYLLNNLYIAGQYTQYGLEEFVSLKSQYAKNLYRLLSQFRSTGYFTVKVDEFRSAMGIPSSYLMGEIKRRVITPAVQECSKYYDSLKVEYIRGEGRGGPINRIVFTFQDNRSYNDHNESLKESIYICPYCHQRLYEKEINGSRCYCHPDGASTDAKCSVIFNSAEEIKDGKHGEFKGQGWTHQTPPEEKPGSGATDKEKEVTPEEAHAYIQEITKKILKS